MIDIFKYTNHRLFLKDYYEDKKKDNSNFSYRYIAMKVGFKSAGQFSQIIKGTANVSRRLLYSFSKFLKLKKREAEYFELIVNYTQAKTQDEKKFFFERISVFTGVSVKKLGFDHYEFYQKWYYAAVRDILSIFEFKDDYRKLSQLLEPAISTLQARKAIALLEKLEMIKKNENGVYKVTDPLVSSSPVEGHSIALTSYAIGMLDMAKNAANNLPKSERSISCVGVSLSKETFDVIQEEVRVFRKKILSIAERDTNPERVYHFNIQCFPLSKRCNRQGQKGTI